MRVSSIYSTIYYQPSLGCAADTKKIAALEKARSMSPLNLARESFEVTPSVKKVPSKRTATAQASNNFVLSENIGSGSKDKIVYVQQLCKKIRKPAPSPPESSQEV